MEGKEPVIFKVYNTSNSVKMLPEAKVGVVIGMDMVNHRVVIYDPSTDRAVKRRPEAVKPKTWQTIPYHVAGWWKKKLKCK
jgi:hypothetical protein